MCFRISKYEKRDWNFTILLLLCVLESQDTKDEISQILFLSCASESQNTKEDETSEPDRWDKPFQTWKIWNYDDHIELGSNNT